MTRILYLLNYILNLEWFKTSLTRSRWHLFNNGRHLRDVYISPCIENFKDIYIRYQNIGIILHIEERALNFLVMCTLRRSLLQNTFLHREYAPLCLTRRIILSRRLDVTRIFIATDSIFSPEWRGPRSNFTRAAPTPLRHSPPTLNPLIFLLRCLVAGPPSLRSSCRSIRSHEFPWNYVTPSAWAGRAELIITFDRNYGNEMANYKKRLQAASGEGGGDFSYDTTQIRRRTTTMLDTWITTFATVNYF